ncbi:uncharacterized protein LOC107265735 [Cephus cinctus]|uniref:Uncharacterized protein LOC107265735 n=1 Tax=Cephus cinctus TaxID=211228 RepID=A0AAJ7RDB4_CEPCN|nr:uncharacterized protein LOC107265735 [Cephus cinctus]
MPLILCHWFFLFWWSFAIVIYSEASADVMKHPNWSLLDDEQCGISNSDRIIGGKNASLGAYPWITRIGYSKISKMSTELIYRCGGSLINKIYVLTAAHCVANLPASYRVSRIRLGEHNTVTNPDCENDYCGEAVQDLKPVKIIVHKGYNHVPFKNDIALIRLEKPAKFSEFVKPICMVRDELLLKDFLGQTAEVAGWGIYDINDPRPSTILQTIRLPIVDVERCRKAFKSHADVGEEQICVGGVIGQDSCGGDSGGPLMKVESVHGPPKYFIIGLVSFGAKHCGESMTPAVYTKMSYYLSWILNNISSLLQVNKIFKSGHRMWYLLGKLLLLEILLTDTIYAQFPSNVQSDCTAPNNVPGNCISIRNCPALLSLLQSRPLTSQTITLLRQVQCGFEGRDPKVCCARTNGNVSPRPGGQQISPGTETPLNPSLNPTVDYNLSQNSLLPSDCGRDLSQRIVGGERTDLDEFPWMTLLEYTKPNGRTTACGGVLISRRYVLTAAHCIKGKDLPKSWNLVNVRLGEYDTETETDCIQDGDNTQVCADDPISIGIEEQIAHEGYKPASRDQRNDIALLRLSRDVTFTDFIKPICLPTNSSFGQKLFVAGWGKTESRSESNVKLKVSIPIVENSECSRTYNNAGVRLGAGQICAGGQRGKDSCRGDSGGPLMSVERSQDGTGKWTAVGVVSFGPSPCGMQGWPGVYTKVADFIPWILSKMRP